jgi:hypothetical protein
MFAETLNLLFWFAALVLISYLLDRLWSNALWPWLYIIFAAPGIIVHEISHYLACKITFAEIFRVTLISKKGGSVAHGPPKGGVFGQVVISMAPFIGIPLILILLALLFDRIAFFNCDLTWSHDLSGNIGEIIIGTLSSAFDLIKINLWDKFSPWFLLYLYIAASLTMALAPSKQDFINAWVGLAVLAGLILGWSLALDHLLENWSAPVATFSSDLFGWIIAVGLLMCLFGLLLGLPFLILKKTIDRERIRRKAREKQREKEREAEKERKKEHKKERAIEKKQEKLKEKKEKQEERKKIEQELRVERELEKQRKMREFLDDKER